MSRLLITVLTGRRPRLLGQTLRALESQCSDLLASARVIAFVNGGDEPSVRTVRQRDWVDECLVGEEPLLGIGAAVTHLWRAAKASEHEYLMHLEDDWSCAKAWFLPARTILERDPKVGQVRLRRHVPQSAVGHAVMRYHMVTGRPLHWEERRAKSVKYLRGRAHLTFNPSLIRGEVASSLLPCKSELDAAGKFHRTGLLSAQWIPGSFGHLGGDNSLREGAGSE